MTPLLGLAFLTSAISRMGGLAESAEKNRTGGASASRRRNVDSGLSLFAGDFFALRGDDVVENGGHDLGSTRQFIACRLIDVVRIAGGQRPAESC